jgi:hypothetical protein
MASIADVDRTVFDNLSKGVHDFDEGELARLHKMAEELKSILQSANQRQEKTMMARNQFRQMG